MVKAGNIACVLGSVIMAVGIMSCSKEDFGSSKHPIGFHCAGTGTKAFVDTDNIKTEGNAFKVFAHIDFTEAGTTSSFDRVVTYSSADGGKWEYEVEQYWLPGASYTFRAYYPADFPATISETSKTEYAISGYEISSQYGTQNDILMATANRKTSEVAEDGTTVLFSFNHLLSNVNLILKVNTTEREKVDENGDPVLDSNGNNVMETIPALDATIRAMAFIGVTQKADYINGSWTNHSGTTAIGDNLSNTLDVTPEGVMIFDKGLLTIPRENENGTVQIYILADITLPNGTSMEKEWNLPLPAITWEPGIKYTYTATLTAEFNIEFTEPEVESWGKDPAKGTVIIR